MAIESDTRQPGESVSAWYWRRGVTSDDWFLEDRTLAGTTVPPLTKLYTGPAPQALPYEPLGDLGDVDGVLHLARGVARHDPAAGLDLADDASLSAFLMAAFGFCRHETGPRAAYPYHRTVASARCRFPTQMYVLLPDTEARAQGVYYFDALHHALVEVAPGVAPPDLGVDVEGPGGQKPSAVFVLTSLFWNTACTYQHYAYRLCTQEAGLTLGNLEVVAAAHGLASRPCYDFDADRVAGALRLPVEQESPMAVLPVWGGGSARWLDSAAPPGALLDFEGREDFDPEFCRAVLVTDRQARVSRTQHAPPGTDRPTGPPTGSSMPARVPPPSVPLLGLAEALRRRDSGGLRFLPHPEPVDRDLVAWMLACARADDTGDLSAIGVRLVVAASNVTGLDAGTYEWRPSDGTFATLRLGPVVDHMSQVVGDVPPVRMDAVPFAVFAVVDHDAAFTSWGSATIPVSSAECGAVVHRLMLAASACGLASRVLNAFRPSGFRALTGFDDEQSGPVFSVFLGRRSPGTTIEFPLP